MTKIKENMLTVLAIFTFVIPVIPIGSITIYHHLFSKNTAISKQTKAQAKNVIFTRDQSINLQKFKPQSSRNTFDGYDCSSDCSGHEAGYQWGEDNNICDTEYDNGNSESFNEGVRAWAEDNC